ncbi:MAG: hypothetical protein J6P80_03345 [Kiritimatiellae bacterium]|nr:hypothetical protein [Kiritimatiellia bacterium]
MTARDYILCTLEAELALERELGVRVLELEHPELLKGERAGAPKPAPATLATPATKPVAPKVEPALAAPKPVAQKPANEPELLFLHAGELSPEARVIVGKIAAALGVEMALATELPLPEARRYVVLGAEALERFFPGVRASLGSYLPQQRNAYLTHSPELFVRYGTGNALVTAKKQQMWNGIKGLMKTS